MSFEDWLDDRLGEEQPEWYDPEGNSAHAVVARMRNGYTSALRYECKEVLLDIEYMLFEEFDGFETPVGWFVQLLLLPFLLPFIPFMRAYFRYRRALKDFKESYLSQHNHT